MDMEHHPVAVDIRDFQMQRLLQAQAAGIGGGKEDAIVEGVDARKHSAHLLAGEHRRQAEFLLGAQVVEGSPVALEDMGEEKADPRMGDAHRIRRPLVDVAPVQKVILKLRLRDQLRGLLEKLQQVAHGTGIGLLSSFSFSSQLQGAHRFFVPVGHAHGSSPFLLRGMSRGIAASERKCEMTGRYGKLFCQRR